jgi:hypothetical protein
MYYDEWHLDEIRHDLLSIEQNRVELFAQHEVKLVKLKIDFH